jgi:uncharacterized membrane protein
VPPPWHSHPATPGPERRQPDDRLRGGSVVAYFLPLFTSLVLVFSRSRNVKYHAIQCALIDALATFYFLIATVPAGLYASARYGDAEVPAGDVVMITYAVLLFAIPIGLRAYCLFQIVRKGTARLKFIGTLAHRVAYGGPANDAGRP